LGQVNDLLVNLGRRCYHLYQHRFPCFTQSECDARSRHPGKVERNHWARVGRLFRVQAERKQALRTGAERHNTRLATRSGWRLWGALSPKVPYCLFRFFETVVPRRELRAQTFRGSGTQPSAAL